MGFIGKKWTALIVAGVLIVSLGGCAQEDDLKSSGANGGKDVSSALVITDLDGRELTLPKLPKRIVSLSPTNTELVFAVGGEDKLVGVTSYCDYPKEALKINQIGDFASPNIELIAQAKPDVVLAGSYMQADTISALENLGIPVVSTEAESVEQVYKAIALLGELTGETENATQVIEQMKKDLTALSAKTEKMEKKSVFYVVWKEPLKTAGKNTFIDEVITLAGGKNVAGTLDGWPDYSREQLLQDQPEVLIAAKYCTDTGETKEELAASQVFNGLSCLKDGRLYMISDDNIISRGTPRLVLAAMEISRMLE